MSDDQKVRTLWGDWDINSGSSRPAQVPDDYAFLWSGDGPLTSAVKRTCTDRPIFVCLRKSGRYVRTSGLYAPASVIEACRADLARRAEALRKRRATAEQRAIRQFAEAIRKRYPGCPQSEAEAIAVWTCEVGSGRVGRSSVADDPVRAAVVAHVRHSHTDYDRLLDESRGWTFDRSERDEARAEAREAVRDQVYAVLAAWEASGDEAVESGVA